MVESGSSSACIVHCWIFIGGGSILWEIEELAQFSCEEKRESGTSDSWINNG